MTAATRPPATVPARTMSSRDFNHNRSGAKKLTTAGPVIITDRGRPTHVIMSIEDYERLGGASSPPPERPMSLLQALAQADATFDFDPPRLSDNIFKPAELD